jgi:hypothetical protein
MEAYSFGKLFLEDLLVLADHANGQAQCGKGRVLGGSYGTQV